ncbi:MAG: glycosyltransferase [Chitinophagales bacterium]
MTSKKTHIFESNTAFKVIVAPLNWGLGHATRCMPIINALLQRGLTVIIASDGRALSLLKKEYPTLQHIELPAYDIQYSGHTLGLVPTMLLQVPKILKTIRAEQRLLQKIVEEEQIDLIISDNRYGCYVKGVLSVFVSHQLFLKMPPFLQFLEPTVAKTQMYFIRHFSSCWIPDFPSISQSLSGDLAHKQALPKAKFRFVGALSRMKKKPKKKEPSIEGNKELKGFLKEKYDIVAVLSGPEPQRTLFEEMLQKQILEANLEALVVKGITENQVFEQKSKHLQVVNFLTAKELNRVLLAANMVIARSGYSTIMDLAALGKKAILIPTPGQTEQIYLANYFQSKGIFYTDSQSSFDLQNALKESENYTGFSIEVQGNDLLKKAIESLLQKAR